MHRIVITTLTAVMALNAGLATAAPATARSSGAAFNFTFDVNGSAATLRNQVYAAGSAPPAYNVKKTQAKFNHIKTYPNHLAVTTTGSKLVSTAMSTGLNAAGGITATATAAVGSASSTVKSPTITDVSFSGTNISSSANYSVTKKGVGTTKGSAKIGSLNLSAPFFQVPTITYSGTPTPNKVLYRSADGTVIVYANRQVTTQLAGNKTGITVNAIDMVVKNYAIGPYTVNGELAVSTSIAQK
jgi:hypothetical protein